MHQEEKQEEQVEIAGFANEIQRIHMEGYAISVRKARNALYWAGGLLFAGEMLTMYSSEQQFDLLVFILAVFEAAIFVGLALWTRKKPYYAVLTGLLVYILVILSPLALYAVMGDVASGLKAIFSGVIVKAIILVVLGRSLKDARLLQDAQKSLF